MVDLRIVARRAGDWLMGRESGPPVSAPRPLGLKTIHGTPIQTTGSADIAAAGTPINTMPGVMGVSPAANLALSSAAVWACCRLISTSIASLPTEVYEVTPDGKKVSVDHPLYSLLTTSPNPAMTLQQVIQPVLLGLLLYGNAYLWIDRINDEVIGLWPLNPARVHMVLNEDGTFSYYYSDLRGKFNAFTEEEIIHFRVFTFDGYFGLPVLIYHRMQIDFQTASNSYALALYNNGGQPGGVLTYPGVLTEAGVARIRDSWQSIHSGPANAGRVAILEQGATYSPIGIPPEQLQYIEEQKFSVEQIARIFGVPPHMIGAMDKPTYASVEQMSIEFVRYTLYPYVRAIEQAFDKALLEPPVLYRFDLNAFERGDITARYQSYATGRQWGWLSANDVRTKEDMNTFEGGDDYLTPLNMVATPPGQQPATPPPAPAPKPGG
jgi:HK97 family phage portal protein